MEKKTSIVFMGSADFAVPALEKLSEDADVKLVVVQPDKKSGRGNKIRPLPVKKKALELGLEIFQPENISSEDSQKRLEEIEADLFVVCAYGQILKENILNIPKFGSLNIHGSILPQYRGAAPIQRAILDGKDKTGISFMLLNTGMDTGPVLKDFSVNLDDNTTFETLHDELAQIGAENITEVIDGYLNGKLEPIKQDETKATYADKIEKEEGRINWNRPAKQILRQINALDPIPGAFTLIDNKKVKLFSPKTADIIYSEEKVPGTILSSKEEGKLIILCKDGPLELEEIQFPGKRRMAVKEFFKGNNIEKDLVLDSSL